MANRTKNENLIELWDGGMSPEEAAWIFASEYEKNKARKTTTLGALESYYVLFRRNLLDKLFYGELFAYGFRIGTSPSAGPEPIPRHLFRDPKLDWGESSLVSGGHRYEQVRSEKQAEGLDQETRAASSGEVKKQPSGMTGKKRMGRPPVGEQLRFVVRELKQANRLSGKSRKEQENVVREQAHQTYPGLFLRPGQPSRAKILEALKAEGN